MMDIHKTPLLATEVCRLDESKAGARWIRLEKCSRPNGAQPTSDDMASLFSTPEASSVRHGSLDLACLAHGRQTPGMFLLFITYGKIEAPQLAAQQEDSAVPPKPRFSENSPQHHFADLRGPLVDAELARPAVAIRGKAAEGTPCVGVYRRVNLEADEVHACHTH